jgi:hypothetical protein
MKKLLLILAFVGACSIGANAQKKIPHTHRTCKETYPQRTEILLPQVNGYNIYKADFHIHTSYSDGRVTPAERVHEAWRDGLDIIAITDHYEGYRNIKKMLKVTAGFNENGQPAKYQSAFESNCIKMDFNAIHEEAIVQRDKSNYDLLIIKGCEMARNAKTHGHFNCLFLDDINTLYDKELENAFDKVHAQGGLVIHNHPSYVRGTTDKSEFHEKVYGAGKIDGVEVANGFSFYPPIVRRCVDEKLVMLGCTDEHGTTQGKYGKCGVYRTMTLVLAKDKSEKSIKEALLKRRTIAYSGGQLIGEEKLLADYLNAAIDCRLTATTAGKKRNSHIYTLTNTSSITIHLRRGKTTDALEPFKTITASYTPNAKTGEVGRPKFTVENMWHIDYKHPVVELNIDKK